MEKSTHRVEIVPVNLEPKLEPLPARSDPSYNAVWSRNERRRRPEWVRERTRRSLRKLYPQRLAFIQRFKRNPCVDCGVEYPPYVMDFDHRGDKTFQVSRMGGRCEETIIAEIARFQKNVIT